jgi:hypothetical protein
MSLPDDSAADMFATGSDGNANQSRSGFEELGRRRDQSNFRLHGTITGPPTQLNDFPKFIICGNQRVKFGRSIFEHRKSKKLRAAGKQSSLGHSPRDGRTKFLKTVSKA